MSVKKSFSCSAQSLRTRPGVFFGSAAFQGLILEWALFILAEDSCITCALGADVSFYTVLLLEASKRM